MTDCDPTFRDKINSETTEHLLLISLLSESQSRQTARQELRRRRRQSGYANDAVADFLE